MGKSEYNRRINEMTERDPRESFRSDALPVDEEDAEEYIAETPEDEDDGDEDEDGEEIEATGEDVTDGALVDEPDDIETGGEGGHD